MAVIKLYGRNPTDLTDTFDQMDFGEADDSSGTNSSVVDTEDLDTTTADVLSPGFTSYTYTSGNTAKYYAVRWKISSSGATSDWSDWVRGGLDRWDTLFMEEMDDSNEDVWTESDREKLKDAALEALYPELFRQVIDTSLSIVNSSTTQTYIYTVPQGIFDISEVGVGPTDTTSSESRDYDRIKNDYWRFERNKLHLETLSGFTNGATIRLVGAKKYSEVGEVPKRLDPLAMLHMRSGAYLQLADDFPRFKKWGRIQGGTKVSFENLRVHAREFERKFESEKNRLEENQLASLL